MPLYPRKLQKPIDATCLRRLPELLLGCYTLHPCLSLTSQNNTLISPIWEANKRDWQH